MSNADMSWSRPDDPGAETAWLAEGSVQLSLDLPKSADEPECRLCVEYAGRLAPSHKPSPRCESGKRPHCTCDTCF